MISGEKCEVKKSMEEVFKRCEGTKLSLEEVVTSGKEKKDK